jgi:hypothetical protein
MARASAEAHMKGPAEWERISDPLHLARILWPDTRFYNKQQDIIYSVMNNDSTYVPAGNMLGKDFVAGFIALCFFLTRWPCRVVTTSADNSQLESVLWGEIRRFIETSKFPLEYQKGGPLVVNHLHIRRMIRAKTDKRICSVSYIRGRVSAKGEGMLGHHVAEYGDGIPRTLFIADEASGVEDTSNDRADTWAKRKLIIGNPYPPQMGCTFFKDGVKAGDLLAPSSDSTNTRYYRKVVHVAAEDSPNVRLALLELEKPGVETPTNRIVLPGVLPYADYKKRRDTWDIVKQTIGLDGRFYEGAEVLLFPPTWLDRAEKVASELDRKIPDARFYRQAKAIGIDPAEGGDKTSMAAIDEFGLIELVSKKTPNTAVIVDEALAFMRKHKMDHMPHRVMIDAGGGGKQHADRLRAMGYGVSTVAFGGAPTEPMRMGKKQFRERLSEREERFTYLNRRAEMYGQLRLILEPIEGTAGFGLPAEYINLRRELAPIPLLYDREGKLRLPPKHRVGQASVTSERTLEELIGHSPDEADALVLAVYGMLAKSTRRKARGVVA